jgi:hypothetical protein
MVVRANRIRHSAGAQSLLVDPALCVNWGMDKIHYAGSTVVTGTEIARALLAYARELARNNESDTVDVPVLHEDGSLGISEFLVGPASQLVADSFDTPSAEIVDTDLVERLVAATLALSGPRAIPVESAGSDGPFFPDFGDV